MLREIGTAERQIMATREFSLFLPGSCFSERRTNTSQTALAWSSKLTGPRRFCERDRPYRLDEGIWIVGLAIGFHQRRFDHLAVEIEARGVVADLHVLTVVLLTRK
jgi:hypothetical protein